MAGRGGAKKEEILTVLFMVTILRTKYKNGKSLSNSRIFKIELKIFKFFGIAPCI